jgi:hypothetical protein
VNAEQASLPAPDHRKFSPFKWEQVDFKRGMLLLPDSKTGKKAIVLNGPALDVLANLPRVGASC